MSSSARLVLLHGATSSSRAWAPILQMLTPHHDVFVPTLAGHLGGPPLSVAPPLVVEGIVDAMCRQLDDAGIDSAHLVGNSLGGWVALELARRGRAKSVLALSPAGAWSSANDLKRLLTLFRLGAAGARHGSTARMLVKYAVLRRMILRLMAERGDQLSAIQIDEVFADMAGCGILNDLLAGARQRGPMVPFERLECPVRLAWGIRDRMLPFMRYGAPMLSALPGADLVLVPDVGHVPMIDDSALVGRMILDFVEAVSAGEIGQ
jgi:pimeloyl-ACP methyl ester carboxylesterase